MAKIENVWGNIDRLKQTQKVNRQTPKGSMNYDAQKSTHGTTRKVNVRFHKYSNRVNKGISKDSNTTKSHHNGQVVYNTG